MAEEKKPVAKKTAPAAAKKAAAPKAEAAAKPAAAKAAKAAKAGPPCRIEGCKQAVRAKGYCRKHYIGWRRGDVGKKHRYKVCSKEGCRKPARPGGRCEEHGRNAKAGDAAAAPAAG